MHLNHLGVKKQPTDYHVGVDGAWVKIVCRLIAIEGKWVEVYDNEPNFPEIQGINAIDKRGVYPGEIIRVTGLNLGPFPVPALYGPNYDFNYYPLHFGLSEHTGYSPDLKIGNVSLPVTFNTGLNVNGGQFVTVPLGSEGG